MGRKINLNGEYVCMANWCILKKRDDRIFARNCLFDEETEITLRQAQYLLRLDGNRNPLYIKGFTRRECIDFFQSLDELYLIRKSGRRLAIDSSNMFTLYIPSKKKTNSIIPKLLNLLLMFSWLPVFVSGLVKFIDVIVEIDFYEGSWFIGYLVGLVLGIILHELGHAIASLSYGGIWLEAGVMLTGILPGAYVLTDDNRIRKRLKRVQSDMAGIEMNILLVGVCLHILCQLSWYPYGLYKWTGALLEIAILNVYLAALNLLFKKGLDGERCMSLLLGKGSMVENAKANIQKMFSQKTRREYFEVNGINGVANICTSIAIMGFQLMALLIILFYIASVVGGIFL